MKRVIIPLLAYAILGATGVGTVWADDTAGPSVDELKQMMADKKYRDVVTMASRELMATQHAAPAAEGAASVDRYALFMLKAEAQLQLKQHTMAAETFGKAAGEAQNPADAQVALATAELAKRSPNLKFMPAARGSSPIDVSDATNRKAAFAALYAEVSAGQAEGYRRASDARTLDPIASALKNFRKLRALEIAATGADTQSQAILKDVGAKALEMLYDKLNDDAATVAEISGRANSMTEVIVEGMGSAGTFKDGLTARDKQKLNQIIGNCQDVAPAAKEISDATDDPALKKAAEDVEKVFDSATTTLTKNYGPKSGF